MVTLLPVGSYMVVIITAWKFSPVSLVIRVESWGYTPELLSSDDIGTLFFRIFGIRVRGFGYLDFHSLPLNINICSLSNDKRTQGTRSCMYRNKKLYTGFASTICNDMKQRKAWGWVGPLVLLQSFCSHLDSTPRSQSSPDHFPQKHLEHPWQDRCIYHFLLQNKDKKEDVINGRFCLFPYSVRYKLTG